MMRKPVSALRVTRCMICTYGFGQEFFVEVGNFRMACTPGIQPFPSIYAIAKQLQISKFALELFIPTKCNNVLT
jgi:hypothetical protein